MRLNLALSRLIADKRPTGISTVVLASLLLTISTSSLFGQGQITEAERDFFEERIRPILVDNCYECHNSVDAAEGGLALDYRGALRRGGDQGPVINAEPAQSRLLQVVRHEIEGLEMPEGGPKLSQRALRDLEEWIRMGAPDPRIQAPTAGELAQMTAWETLFEKRKQWWSFQPIVSTPAPQNDHPEWSQSFIDQFLFQAMSDSGLSPNPPASRTQLIRRLYFALIGLPPTPENIEDFLRDEAPGAFERLVDDLLRSPEFGARWARHWMDWVRYAESHGSEGDPRIAGAYHYRDYLIRALNADVPYDQLLREHIAGDLIDNPRINTELALNESAIGTAHWRMVFHGFAPTDALDERVRFVDDAVGTFSKAFLGLTVACARCHNHKFDAISQTDYYALFGILNSTRPGRISIDVEESLNRNRSLLADTKKQIRRQLALAWKDALSDSQRADQSSNWLNLLKHPGIKNSKDVSLLNQARQAYEQFLADQRAFEATAVEAWDLAQASDFSEWFRSGNGLNDQPNPAGDFSISQSGSDVLGSIHPPGAISGQLSTKHGARITSPDFAIQHSQKLWVQLSGDGNAMSRYVVQNYPRNGTVFPVTTLQGEKSRRWRWQAYDLSYWDGDLGHVELVTAMDAPLLVKNDSESWFGVRKVLVTPADVSPPSHDLAFLGPVVREMESENAIEGGEPRLVTLIQKAVRTAIDDWQRGTVGEESALLLDRCLQLGLLPKQFGEEHPLAHLLSEYRTVESQVPVARRVPALEEWRGQDQPLYVRGDHRQAGEVVPRGFLSAINASPYEGLQSGRLELARDMTNQGNPFPARVIVNRVWHHLFGQGIVETPDNFGRLGVPPTHPELLDELSHRFVHDNAWSIKALIRTIVTSQAWKQDSRPSKKALELDPQNHRLSHFPVLRLEAEAIRDALLSAAGRLDTKQFGPAAAGKSNRRSVYVQVIRNRLDPFLSTFDAPVPFSAKGRRDRTNVPAQSLLMMNDARVRELASAFANRTTTVSDSQRRVRKMWLTAFAREPSDEESQAAQRFLTSMLAEYESRLQGMEEMAKTIDDLRAQQQALLKVAMDRLEERLDRAEQSIIVPAQAWDFRSAGEANESTRAQVQLHGDARMESDGLHLSGNGWATAELKSSITEKTLEVVVRLENLGQRGGGVFSIQTRDGSVFDAIVFGEQKAQHWTVGSNFFRRTQALGAPAESGADQSFVHLVVVYSSSGEVRFFRNGQAHGKAYKTDEPVLFDAANTQLLFGMRHGTTSSGNRMLRGTIQQAKLYDRALTPEQVGDIALANHRTPTREQIAEALGRARFNELETLEAALQRELGELDTLREGLPSGVSSEQLAWVDLAHALINMKEFIYVR